MPTCRAPVQSTGCFVNMICGAHPTTESGLTPFFSRVERFAGRIEPISSPNTCVTHRAGTRHGHASRTAKSTMRRRARVRSPAEPVDTPSADFWRFGKAMLVRQSSFDAPQVEIAGQGGSRARRRRGESHGLGGPSGGRKVGRSGVEYIPTISSDSY